MSKAFTREADSAPEDEEEVGLPSLPPGTKNYLTPGGFARLRNELTSLVEKERPEVVSIVSWAAGNGDRSENGDYIYGKKRLREIDRRIRYLVKRLDLAEVVDPEARGNDEHADQVFFGATVTLCAAQGKPRIVAIVGLDEIDAGKGYISWVSPMARALLRAREGDLVTLRTPGGVEEVEILEVKYQHLDTGR
ncbi:MAG: transcription elongation factor GreB [Betaproteobacteria bacterium]|nr:transcription elongation factor GreB [Betaproteobacteria bacterium]